MVKNLKKISGKFHENQSTLIKISRCIQPERDKVSDKGCRGNQNAYVISNIQGLDKK